MGDPKVRIVQAEAMRAAVKHGEGAEPERLAVDALDAFAKSHDLLANPSTYHLFGRNNPSPTPGKAEYGYDSMITVDPDFEADGVEFIGIPSGTFAVVRTNLTNITKMWYWIYEWVEKSEYEVAGHGLEEPLSGSEADPDHFVFDLWLPIKR
jgi:DNA gyrase inhibitor GyrI